MSAQLGRKLRAAAIALDATTRNVEADRCADDELEVLARVCDELARALRADASPIEGTVIGMARSGAETPVLTSKTPPPA